MNPVILDEEVDKISLTNGLFLNHNKIKNSSSSSRHRVIIHELGHALGLAHSFGDNVMSYERLSEYLGIGPEDKKSYNCLWVTKNCKK